MYDGFQSMAYGHKDIIAKVESIWEGSELFLMSADEAKSKGLHPSHPIDPNMMQPRAPKMYSYQTLNDPSNGQAGFTTKKRAKGIQRAVVGKLRHEQFNAQLDQPEETYVTNRRIGSKLHQIYGIMV